MQRTLRNLAIALVAGEPRAGSRRAGEGRKGGEGQGRAQRRQDRRERREHPAGALRRHGQGARVPGPRRQPRAHPGDQGRADQPRGARPGGEEARHRQGARRPDADGHGAPGRPRARPLRERDEGAPRQRRRPREAVRDLQGLDGHQRVQGAPHPGRQGRRRQGDHRPARQGRRLRHARQGEVEGPGLQGQRRRPRLGSPRAAT